MSQLTEARGNLTPTQAAILLEFETLADSGACQFLAKVSGHFVNLSIGACATASPVNGLALIGADIGLGGTLTMNTAIDANTFTFDFTDLGDFLIQGTNGRGLLHDGTNIYLSDSGTTVSVGVGANKIYVKTPNVVGATAVVGQALKLVNLTTGEVEFGTVSSAAIDITYSNATSGLTATDVQAAIDEVVTLIGTGGITGSGVSGRVTIWNGTATVTSDADFTFNTTTNALTAGRINLFSPVATSMMVGPLLASAVGDYNTIGGIGAFTAATTSQYVTVWGAYAAATATNHAFSVFIGAEAGRFAANMFGSICIGWRAGYYATSTGSVYIGNSVGSAATGSNNMLLGIGIGTNALFSGGANTIGGANSFGTTPTSADGNSGWGQDCFVVLTTADFNSAIGYRSGYTVTSGGYSVFAGSTADVTVGTVASVICIGYGAKADTNNIAVIGGLTSNGYITDLYLGNGKENATPLAQVKVHVTGGDTSANNIIGSDVWWMAGIARGSGLGGNHFFYTSDATTSGTTLQTSTSKFQVSVKGNVVAGSLAVVSTSATDGFLYIPTCAGTPSGTPTAYTGKDAIVYDSTNDLMYIYEGGAWRTVGSATVDQFKTMAADSGTTTANSPTDTFTLTGGRNISTSIVGDAVTIRQTEAWQMDPGPSTDLTANGPQTTLNSAGAVTAGELLYYTSSSNCTQTDADAESTSKGMLGVTLTSTAGVGSIRIALPGSFIRNDAWAWTPGAKLYVSTTAGAMTETAPSGTGDVVRVVGFAISADTMYFYPGDTVVLV